MAPRAALSTAPATAPLDGWAPTAGNLAQMELLDLVVPKIALSLVSMVVFAMLSTEPFVTVLKDLKVFFFA
jgi:hypothetical protein